MNPIFHAIQSGYSEEEILSFLSKSIPQLANPIKKATRSGYGIKQILGFLSKNFDTESIKGKSESEIHAINKRSDSEHAKYGLTMAATAVAAPLAANAAKSVLGRALPQSLSPQFSSGSVQNSSGVYPSTEILPSSQLPTGSNPTTPPQQNISTPSSLQTPANQIAASIPEPANIQQPKGFDTNIIKNGLVYKRQIDSLISSGNGPEEIEAYLKKFNPQFIKTIEKEGKGHFKDIVGQYIQEKMRDDALQPEGSIPNAKEPIEPQLQETEKLLEPIKEPEKPKIEKNSVVSSPNGIGQVKELRNGQAIIDVDGKLHKVKEEDLESPIYSEDEIADTYEKLMTIIPEAHRSGFISWAGYDEDRNVLGFIPRGGKYEELTDITPEEAQMIKEGKGVARTSGENKEGLWVSGEDTRGGVISQIIWDRKHKKDAQEKKQGKFDFNLPKPEKQDRGMKPVFDEMSHARNLSREREKKKKLEERARLKKEKDEAKKRKKQA